MTQLDLRADALIDAMTAQDGMFPVGSETIRGITYKAFTSIPQTLDGYFDLAAMHADKEFLVYDDTRLSFAEALTQAKRLGHVLRTNLQMGEGDRVGIAMRNYPEWFLSFIAITGSGGVAVPVNAWWSQDEFEYGLNDCGARIVICDEERIAKLLPLKDTLGLTLIGVRLKDCPEGVLRFEDVIAQGPDGAESFPHHDQGADDDALILYTSGTTGNPKGAVSTHRGVLSTLFSWVVAGLARNEVLNQDKREAGEEVPEVAPQNISLVALPMFHVTGCHAVFLVSILLGRKLVLMYKWDAVRAMELIEAEKITGFVGVPTMSWELAQHPDRENYDLSTLVDIGGGGAARPPEHVKQLNDAFPQAQAGIGYGLTETNALGATNSGANYSLKPGSTGRPTPPLVEIKLVDPDGAEVAQGDVGEVLIKSPSNIRCYWNNPEATGSAFTEDGFFRTGDVGRFDEDGFLYIVDRIKDIVVKGGENISCIEVEAAIAELDGVLEVAAFGVPDERLGEELAAVIYLKPGTALSEEQVRSHIGAHHAKFKVPAYIEFTDAQLMRGATGKILKRGIKDDFIARHGL